MTDEQINTAIAEALGWTGVHLSEAGELIGKKPGSDWHKWKVPNFTGSLDAMHEVAYSLEAGSLEYSDYCSWLNQVCAMENSKHNGPCRQTLDATARQRAEAFLRTAGGWEE